MKKQNDKKITKENKETENEKTYKQPKIFNLSCKTLSKQQLNILLKGLKFTPTPQQNIVELKGDLQIFADKLRTVEYFDKNDENGSELEGKSLIKGKSKFKPPKSSNKILENEINNLTNMNFETFTKENKSNLTKKEWFALKSLMNDPELVIKKADKGGSVVIMSANHYEKMVYSQLLDGKTYEKLKANKDFNIAKNLAELIKKYKKSFTEAEFKCLTSTDFKTSQFYGLPKVHKSKILEA